MHIAQIEEKLKLSINNALKNVSGKTQPKELKFPLTIELETPKSLKHGDLTTNIAMRLAKHFQTTSVKLAELIKDELGKIFPKEKLEHVISKTEVSPPGFLNFWLNKEFLYGLLREIEKKNKDFGNSQLGKQLKVNIEFVSANPTGPLTIAHGRQAAVGDALARILEFAGFNVCREYFINDVGTQIELLGKSIRSRYFSINGIEDAFPEDGYHGNYIKQIAENLNKKYGKKYIEKTEKNLVFISDFGAKAILEEIKQDLESFGVFFNKWFSQKTLSPRKINNVLNMVKAKGFIYEKDNAVWFKSTAFGDDKDRVVVKTGGAFTYLAPDIAYHLEKYKRGFARLIDIWGPDHHGYIPRLKASVEALGYKKDTVSILIVQLATLLRNGEVLSMSTRKGEFITLKEVIDEVGCDVTKFFFLMRKLDSHLDFDLEVAKKNSLDNPVYYIQYAHARIASILDFSDSIKDKLKEADYNANLLTQPEEMLLLRMLSEFPLAVEASAKTLEPYRIVDFLNELAKVFHSFYTKHRVVSESEPELTKARLALVRGVKTVLANGLELLGISFPERM